MGDENEMNMCQRRHKAKNLKLFSTQVLTVLRIWHILLADVRDECQRRE